MNTLSPDAAYVEKTYLPALEALRADLDAIEEKVVTGFSLSDAIRLGSTVTDQSYNWGGSFQACALGAGNIGAHATGYHL